MTRMLLEFEPPNYHFGSRGAASPTCTSARAERRALPHFGSRGAVSPTSLRLARSDEPYLHPQKLNPAGKGGIQQGALSDLVGGVRQALRSVVTAPTVVAAMPPSSSHMDLSVGVPVKNRLASELNESEALIPKIISAIPTAKRASPMPFFIVSFQGYAGARHAAVRFV